LKIPRCNQKLYVEEEQEKEKKTTKQIKANKTLHSIISEIINSVYLKVNEQLVDIKGVNGRRTQYNGNKEKVQNDKQRSIKLYIENNIEHHETH
jgi:hypothetical protein